MSYAKVNHNVLKPFDGTSVAASTADSTTSEWLDTNGWTDKVVALECTSSGSVDVNVDLYVSSKGYYELNNETTVDTEDYAVVQIVDASTATVYTRFDSDDIADLGKPIRSCKLVVDNDDASDAVVVNCSIEGWS